MVKRKKEEPVEESRNEEQEDAQFLLSATRAPRQGSYEHFLTQSLALTIFMTDDLKRAKAVTVAALMVMEVEREKVAVEYETVQVLNQVASALLNPSLAKTPGGDSQVVSVPWGFPQSEENYRTFILPWYSCKPFFWSSLLTKHGETWRIWHCQKCTTEVLKAKFPLSDTLRFPYRCPRCHNLIVNPYNGIAYVTTFDQTNITREPCWSFFFEVSTCLTPQGYDLLRNNFIAWATPQAQQILAELTRVIDPNLYAEMLGLYSKRGKQGYAEKVKAAAEGVTDANTLGP